MFFSLKWKSIIVASMLTLGLSALFSYLNQRELEQQFHSQRSASHARHVNEISGLLNQSYNHLLQMSDLIPLLNSSEPEHNGSLLHVLNTHWEYLQISLGLESIALFNSEGIAQKRWGEDFVGSNQHAVQLAIETGFPSSEVQCRPQCRHTVIVPIMSSDGTPMVLELVTILADVLRDFKTVTQSDIGIISDTNIAERSLSSWSKSLMAMTNFDIQYQLLLALSRQHTFKTISLRPFDFIFEDRHYEIALIDADPRNAERTYFVVTDDVTDYHTQLSISTKTYVRSSIAAILLSSLLIIVSLWRPITHLKRQAKLLPLLVEKKFDTVCEQLEKYQGRSFIYDEINTLEKTEIEVAKQLKQMQLLIDTHTKKLNDLAMYDSLTGLANRHCIFNSINKSLNASNTGKKDFALLFLDLDNFKRINDSLGHHAGDNLLKVVAKRLGACVRSSDVVARLGGDEFCILINHLSQESDSEIVATNILNVLKNPIRLEENEIIVSASIGIVTAPNDGKTSEELLQNADLAMYKAKAQGRNKFQQFHHDMTLFAMEQLSLETELRQAITKNQFVLYFQPQVDLRSNSIVAVEALIRWQHPNKGILAPNVYIDTLEETGLIVPLGEWILLESCKIASSWQQQGLAPIRLSVNLSARQFHDPGLYNIVEHTLSVTKLDPQWLELEITESMLMNNIENSNHTLEQLKQLGISIAIDDFGTGYSSLSYLKTMPLDTLKIDRSFIKDIPDDEDDVEITAAIIAMAHKLNLSVVAEGIETKEQEYFLKRNLCEIGQGYLYSTPVSENELQKLLIFDQNNTKRFPEEKRVI